MGVLRNHVGAASVVAVAVAVLGGVFAFARPTYQPYVMPPPPNNDLPYTSVSYTAADVRRVFAAERIHLAATSGLPFMKTLTSPGDVLEVDAFGDPQKLKQLGFFDYALVNGHWVHSPANGGSGSPDAVRWHGNVRVVVRCSAAGSSSSRWLRRAALALARL